MMRAPHHLVRDAGVGFGRRFAASMGLLLLALLSGALLSGCGSNVGDADAAEDIPPRRGGTVWLESAKEPPVLNAYLGMGSMSITDVFTTPLKSQWITMDDRGRWLPVIATVVPTVKNGGVVLTPGGGMEIRMGIAAEAVWSDGVPITCDDLEFTWRTLTTERFAIASRLGWEDVVRIDCPTPKRAVIVLDRPLSGYAPTLLATAPLPKHELRGKDFNTVWNNAITVSSGPFVFDRWERGDRLVFERNPRWWRAGAEGKPYLDRVVVRFVPDASTQKLDLRMEDADMIGPPPDTNLPDELAAIKVARYDIKPSTNWENLTFNTAGFPFDDARVRRAAAYAIDRDALVNVVLHRQVPRLDSTLLPSQRPFYSPSFERYRPSRDRVERLMGEAGFERGEGDRWERDGEVARVTLVTFSNDALRIKAIQFVAEQLEQAGFETRIRVAKPDVLFGTYVSRGRFDIALYSFAQPVDPSQSRYFACSEVARAPNWTGKNNAHYCKPELDELLHAADSEFDLHERTRLTREIAERLATDVPVLPLYQLPDTLAWNRRLRGVRPNALGRHLWNIDEWWVVNP